MRKFDVAYFRYGRNGSNERIKFESGIGKKRLITLLESGGLRLDVFFVENLENGVCLRLDENDLRVLLLNDLRFSRVNSIFKEFLI